MGYIYNKEEDVSCLAKHETNDQDSFMYNQRIDWLCSLRKNNIFHVGGLTFGIDNLTLASKLGAQQSIAILDEALIRLNGIRAKMGAVQNRLQSVISNLSITDENISAANSRVRDLDIASETAELAKNNILVQSGVSVLSQTNNSPSVALKLLS